MLDRLDVSFNQLSGYVPGQITLLTSMQVLRLANNRFTGKLWWPGYHLLWVSVLLHLLVKSASHSIILKLVAAYWLVLFTSRQ